MIDEIWKECYYSNKYEVSNLGNMKRTGSNKVFNKSKQRNAYKHIQIDYKNYYVHRLVLLSFKPEEYFEGAVCNHKNGIKSDNRLENLEWCTRKENTFHNAFLYNVLYLK